MIECTLETTKTNWLIQLLPFIFTLFMFVIAKIFESVNNKFRIKKETKRIQDYFHLWIELIQPQTEEQVRRLLSHSKQIENDVFENFVSISIHTTKLKEISTKDKIQAFYTNLIGNSQDKNRAYFELENSVERLQNAQSQVDKVFEINRKAYFEISNEWDSEMHKFNDISTRILTEGFSNESNNIEFMELVALFQDPKFKSSNPIPFLSKNLIKPASDLFIRYYAVKEKDELFFNIGETVRRLNVCTMRYMSFKKSAIINIEFVAKGLNSSCLDLKKASMEITEFKIKPVLCLK